ncbi:MAG: LON peptidase substrate-binding domain-containing protein, partial [Oscillospiraceae bacterium]
MSEFDNDIIISEEVPLLALRGLTVFPEMVMSFDVERPVSLAAVNAASDGARKIFLVAQKDVLKENPSESDLYKIGTLCNLRQFLRSPNGGIRIMVEGVARAKMLEFSGFRDYYTAEVTSLPIKEVKTITTRIEAILRQTIGLFEEFSSLSGHAIPETLISLAVKNDPGYVADYIAQNIFLKHTEKQLILETLDPVKRLQIISGILGREIEVLSIEQQINEKLHEQLVRIQRDNVLREQLKVISAELGEDSGPSEMDGYRERIMQIGFPEETEEKLLKEVDRLSKQPFGSAEASVLRSYLDLCLELPWNKKTKERLDIKAARKILDDDHFGLLKVKERIVEFLAVKKLAPDMKGSILCLVGPPGVGKTSVAISIARATNRKLARMSLGGVHDEAEIRGHRKTYIGAMPGRIIAALGQAESMNPLILLDEIDKLGSDYRGDPSAALLEALDPEQNSAFRDHYMEIPVDLSQVLFITTANTTDTIPRPLLDRVEVIEISSYTDEEKLQIAKSHL